MLILDTVNAATLGLGVYQIGWWGFSAIKGIRAARQLRINNAVGNQFDDYVAQTKLSELDDLGQLGRQQHLPTADVPGRKFVRPDYTIYKPSGKVAAYADAKTGEIALDAQARGLIEWAKATTSRKLIYYTPTGEATIAKSLLGYAKRNGITIIQVAAP